LPDICIFFSEPDENKVTALSSGLENLGWDVWWSKDIRSKSWSPEIEKNIIKSKCVIPIWNSHACREDSITRSEAHKAWDLKKPMVTLVSENVTPPIPFNAKNIVANIELWDCNSDSEPFTTIVESVEDILGLAPTKWEGTRNEEINLFGKILKLPCFVKSLSSHETQLDPEAGLAALKIHPNTDALLISAYDLYQSSLSKDENHKYILNDLEELNKRGVMILLDSGNYESSRKNDLTWTEEKFNTVLSSAPFTCAFCFDDLNPNPDTKTNIDNIISRIKGEFEDILIPIIHAPIENNVRQHEKLPELFKEYASRMQPQFIAVPERELGEGIQLKSETVSKIRQSLNSLGRYQPIHILGTGNPLTILILSAAGADLFDGLEWCRTVADRDTGFLFHHQQFDLFERQSVEWASCDIVRQAMLNKNVRLNLKMAVHNLDFFVEWMVELQDDIKSNKVGNMIHKRMDFQTKGFKVTMETLFPGLF